MPGARCTRGLACKWQYEKAHTSIQVQRKQSGIPCAMALRFMLYSPRRRIRLVTVAAGLTADRPGRIDFATDSLAPATGVGTTQFCRTQQRRSSARRESLTDPGSALRSPCAPALPRPPHPIPRFVTIAIRPSSRVRRGFDRTDLPDGESGNLPVGLFCRSREELADYADAKPLCHVRPFTFAGATPKFWVRGRGRSAQEIQGFRLGRVLPPSHLVRVQ